MRVGLDAHMVGHQETGNETYVKGLVEGFAERPDLDLVIYHVRSPWIPPDGHRQFHRLLTGNPFVRLGAELPLRTALEHLDVLHMTYAAPVWSAAPVVVTIHDICFATNPEWFSARDLRVLRTVVPRSIRKAAHVITVSQDARLQIIDHYRVLETRITAIHNGPGAGAQTLAVEEARAELGNLGLPPGRPFLLTVGNLQPRKNLERLIRAFTELITRFGRELDLVVVGPKRFQGDRIVRSAEPLQERIHFTGYVSDRQLAACYSVCEAFVLPSLYEGFGLPAIEAMAHGAPIACSNTGALPEICGEAAVMFDPLSVEDMVAAIERILVDPALRRRLATAAASRARQFSWRKCAQQTVDVYRSVMS